MSRFNRLDLQVALQKIKEKSVLLDLSLWGVLLAGYCLLLAGAKQRALIMISQSHRSSRSKALRRIAEFAVFRHMAVQQADQPAVSRDDVGQYIGKRIIVLKPPVSARERGIILVKFSELLSKVAASFDLPRLLKDYRIVFEPSWSGYCDRDLLFYTRFKEPVFFLAAEHDDYQFLQRMNRNLVPIDLGPCDWVDPAIAAPFLDQPKIYDIVMNSNWGSWKRHHVLFDAMTRLPKQLKVALIGFEWGGRTIADIRNLANHYGVLEQLTFFERIPYNQVMEINCQSKMAILLSLKEGSNRAVAESFFCDIPAIVLAEHVGGIVKNIVPASGELVPEKDLADGIARMLANLNRYTPRKWAIENIAYDVSTRRLNEVLKASAAGEGGEWTLDIVNRSNSPELRYVSSADQQALKSYTDALRDYLL